MRKVLEVALKEFDSVGYSAATIEKIHVDADVSVGTIYHHFGSKEGIAGALYAESLWSFQRGLIQVLLRSEGAEADVRAAVVHFVTWVDANRARARFLLRRRETEITRANRTDIELLNRRLLTTIEEWRRPLVAAGELRDLTLPLLFAIWFGPAQEYARQELERSRRKPELLAVADALADAAWAALRSSR
jgi:AcrR family transcriptional regulator